MKRTVFPAVIVSLFVLMAMSAPASTVPTPAVKWSQPPVRIGTVGDLPLYTGWDQPSWSLTTQPPAMAQAADDWLCKDNLPVTDFHWWGSYPGWREPQPRFQISAFWFGIYSDVPASANSYSHPGDLVWSWSTTTFGERFVGYDGRIDSTLPAPVIDDSTFEYAAAVPRAQWFFQRSNPNGAPTIYWLSIVAITPAGSVLQWGWKTRPHYFQDDAVSMATVGAWQPLVGPDGASWDLAFAITTIPEPASSLALAAGLIGLAGWIGRKRR